MNSECTRSTDGLVAGIAETDRPPRMNLWPQALSRDVLLVFWTKPFTSGYGTLRFVDICRRLPEWAA